MRKALFAFIVLISTIYCYPVYGQDRIKYEECVTEDLELDREDFAKFLINITLNEEFVTLIENYDQTTTMYCAGNNVNVRQEPSMDGEILGQLMLHTSVEVIAEYDGWNCIGTEDGIAFVYNKYLSDIEPIEYEYNDNDLYIMAHLLAGECQTCPDAEQLYVGSVALNRVSHEGFPDTLEAVVFEDGQYSCIMDGNYYREPTEQNWANACRLLTYGSILPDYVIYQSRRKQGRHVYKKTNYHYYCY